MRAVNFVEHVKLMPDANLLDPRERLLMEQRLLVLWVCLQPFSSARDLLAHEVLAQPRTYDLLARLRRDGYLVSGYLGWTQYRQQRYIPTLRGINFLREEVGLDMGWQMTREGLERISRYVAFFEMAYQLAPRLWKSNAAAPLRYGVDIPPDGYEEILFDEWSAMYQFIWVRNHQLHAIAEYVNGYNEVVSVPFIWYGWQHGPRKLDGLDSVYRGLEVPDHPGYNGPGTSPPGIVFVCADRLSALRVQREFAPDIPKAIVTIDGQVLERLRPEPPRRFFRKNDQLPGRAKVPDGTLQWLEESPHGAALNGVEAARIFRWVENFSGSQITQVARGVGLPRSRVREALDTMIQHDLVWELEGAFYVGPAGIQFIYRRDRQSAKTVESRFSTYIAEDGRYRRQQRRHDRRVAQVAIRFQEAGMAPFTGRRLTLNYPNVTQVKPDLWLAVPRRDGTVMIAAVEVEFSAKDDGAISKKLLPYRTAQWAAGEEWPLYVVAGSPQAANRFARLGDDLPLLVASYDEVNKRGPAGPLWRCRGQQAPAGRGNGQLSVGMVKGY